MNFPPTRRSPRNPVELTCEISADLEKSASKRGAPRAHTSTAWEPVGIFAALAFCRSATTEAMDSFAPRSAMATRSRTTARAATLCAPMVCERRRGGLQTCALGSCFDNTRFCFQMHAKTESPWNEKEKRKRKLKKKKEGKKKSTRSGGDVGVGV